VCANILEEVVVQTPTAEQLRQFESDVVVRLQQSPIGRHSVKPARWLSLFGEHAAGWLMLGMIGVLADRSRRKKWLNATVTVAGAHASAIGIKFIIRRPRPDDPRIQIYSSAPSSLSFPSSHATSTAAAAVVYPPLLGPWAEIASAVPPLAMGLARLSLGKHFPSDVIAGLALGTAIGWIARQAGKLNRLPENNDGKD
jgi:membrane-associated phospholipid phosphatase